MIEEHQAPLPGNDTESFRRVRAIASNQRETNGAPLPAARDGGPWSRFAALFSRVVPYAYFLRFPILGWISLPLLCAIDRFTGASAITRGIMTMERTWQAFYAAFFITALLNTVLICAKNILRNGHYRFSVDGPGDGDGYAWDWLARKLNDCSSKTVRNVLLVAHIPTAITLVYIGFTSYYEEERHFAGLFGFGFWNLLLGFLLGLAAAFCFWWGVSLFYLWIYPALPEDEPDWRPPTALLLPETLWGTTAAKLAWKPRVAAWAEWSLRSLTAFSYVGYAPKRGKPVWEFHTLSAVALAWFLVLYILLYPLTAPVPLSRLPIPSTIFALLIGALFFAGTYPAQRPNEAGKAEFDPGRPVVWVMRALILSSLLIFIGVLWYDAIKNTVAMENAFPVLASILVVLTFLTWLLSGASFFFDRFRIPVLVALVFLLFCSKWALQWVDQEHYFQARDSDRLQSLDTPKDVVDKHTKDRDEPFVIVTATGGGIQAAEWTAQVMAQLEKQFREDPALHQRAYTFHDHLLLASGVSGGSVGLMPYLLEYMTIKKDEAKGGKTIFQTRQPPAMSAGGTTQPDLLTQRLTRAPGCSSLEAVAWGLAYSDLQRLLFTIPLFPSVEDRNSDGKTRSAPDRTWALTESFDRNFSDRDCRTDPNNQVKGQSFSNLPTIESGGHATLRDAGQRLSEGLMPAFTFNATVVETGGRFLMSNYWVPALPQSFCSGRCEPIVPGAGFLPAESFLQAYGMESNCDLPLARTNCYADVSLATAARLSATFPVVSSATRIPRRFVSQASHFVDGGYFDNDGTGSVTEFLLSALRGASSSPAYVGCAAFNPALSKLCIEPPSTSLYSASKKPKLKILLVEIRDGDDMDPTHNDDDLGSQTGRSLEKNATQPSPFRLTQQMLAPLEGMWGAGHESITRRNRRELCLLTTAYSRQLDLHHIVIGVPSAPIDGKPGRTKTAPLNWKLTSAQKRYIEDWATARGKPTEAAIQQGIAWVKSKLYKTDKSVSEDESCTVYDQTYMRGDMGRPSFEASTDAKLKLRESNPDVLNRKKEPRESALRHR